MLPSAAERLRLVHMGLVPADDLERMVVRYQKMDAKYLANRP